MLRLVVSLECVYSVSVHRVVREDWRRSFHAFVLPTGLSTEGGLQPEAGSQLRSGRASRPAALAAASPL